MTGSLGRSTALRRMMPVAVWLAAVGGAYWLYRDTAGAGQAGGVAELKEFTVSSVETGALVSVEAVPGQLVSRGQVVARLDPQILETEIAVAEAELRELQAKVPAEFKTLELSGLQTERTFRAELEAVEVELQAAQSGSARDGAELASIDEELARQRDLVARRLATAARMKELELRRAAVEESAKGWPARLEALETRRQATRARLAEWRRSLAGASARSARSQQILPLQLRIDTQREYLTLLRKRLENLTLRAPADARVVAILARQGSVLMPGHPIMTMVEADPRQVIAYLEEDRGPSVSVGDRAVLRTRSRTGERVEGTVTGVAATVIQLPQRFWPAPTRPRWGREIFIRISPDHKLDPGQAVDVSFYPKGHSMGFATAVEAAPAAARIDASPQPLAVPGGLLDRSRFEPSGIIWAERLQRYILVSDDTGLESANDNAPWVFTMSRDGEVDAEPLVIEGVEAVNDLEALASAPDGTIYLIASQSVNRKGKRRPARTVFVQARLEGRSLKVVRRVFLHQLLAEAAAREPALLGRLGLTSRPDTGPWLEAEGLACRGNEVFLGLKDPLDGSGKALILRIADPDRLFREGSLAGLTLWSKTSLPVEGRPAGISGLLFLDDGSLLMAATNDHGGALFHARRPGGPELEAEQIASYPGLKPEGLCLSPEGDKLIVIFDRQDETPLWARLEIPR
ncbi:MAG: HlyD family efflux transporter periplasmic adaptor subunit [Bryobacteraceae bacterium]|nr:HlyD family efflux transporter periplasmic adaptor subunit [Bryobacteraceae bacterium]